MADENSRKLTKYRIAIFALFVVIAMVGGAVLASPAAAESDTGTLEGEVMDEDGDPVEDADVDVLQDGDRLASTTTDSDGQYDIEIEADEVDYSVIAFKDGFRFDERTVNVDEGVTIEENFTLKELVTLEGQVTDTENTPLEGVEVSPVPEGVVVSGDETDSDGQYEIDLVSGEEYTIEVSDNVHGDTSEEVMLTESDTKDFELEPLSTGTLEGEVADEDGEPIEDIWVVIDQDGQFIDAVQTAEDGTYSVELSEGDYRVLIDEDGFFDERRTVTITQDSTTNEDFELEEAATIEGEVTDTDGNTLDEVDLSIYQDDEEVTRTRTFDGMYSVDLREGEYTVKISEIAYEDTSAVVELTGTESKTQDFKLVPLSTGTLEGEVTDQNGNPLEDAAVEIVQDGEFVDFTTTDADGKYDIELLDAEYSIFPSKSGFQSEERIVNIEENTETTESFELEELLTLEGEVTDTDDNTLEAVNVRIVKDGETIEETQTAPDGKYEVEVVSGEYTVEISDSVHEDISEVVTLTESETKDFELEPANTGTLEGEVTDEGGEPLEEAVVDIQKNGDSVDFVRTDADGQYELEVEDGEYSVFASKSGFEFEKRTVTIEEDATTTETFVLGELVTLDGEVTDEEGDPIEDAWVHIRQDRDFIESVPADEDGEYEIELSPGEYTVEPDADGFLSASTTVDLDDDTSENIELEIAAVVEGTVTDEDDNAVEDIFVDIKQNGALLSSVPTGEDGSYSYDVAEGDYTVSINAQTYEGDSAEVSLTSGETTTQDLEATPASTGTLAGEVTDEDENTIEEADVTIYQDGVFTASTETAEDGTYDLELGEGEYSAFVDTGDSAATTTSISIEADEITAEDFVVEETGTIEGTVRDEDDTEISDSTVDIKQDGELLLSSLTSDDGSYEGPLPLGEYTLTGDANGYEEESHKVTVTEDETVTQEFQLELATGTVEGEVLDEDEDAIEDAEVSITQDDEDVESVSTGEDGFFEAELMLGQYTVSVDEDGYESQDHEVTVTEDEAATQNFELELATGTVEGEVLDEDEDAIEDAEVSIIQDDEEAESLSTSEDGFFEADLVVGQYTVLVNEDGYESQDYEVTVTEDEAATQNFELELATGTVEGEVLDEDEDAIEDTEISITQDDEEVESVSTGEDGSYEAELVLGQYTLSVDEDRYEAQDSEVTLVEGEISIQDFTLVVEEDDESDTGGGGAPSLGPAEFEVSIRDAPDSVVAGETVSVEVAVNNVGGTTGEQTITLSMDGEQIGDESLELSRDQQRFITLTGEVDESAAGEHTFTISSDDDSAETALTIEGDTEEETDETDETDDSETEETDEDDAGETDTDETEDDSEAASDDSTETDETDDEPAEDEIVEDDDQPGFGVTVAVIALLGLLAGTRLSSRKE